jgi:hypothetical protein
MPSEEKEVSVREPAYKADVRIGGLVQDAVVAHTDGAG